MTIGTKCECPLDSTDNPNPASMYLPEEQIGRRHKPGQCPCTYDLKLYERDGKILTLCSCCHFIGDKLVSASPQQEGGKR